ncbi:MAG: hypothetical protein K2O01_02775, partial [Bacteroidales bacterium]|nr:hypothetical protein [Bacteroidales bacterium]
MSLKAQPVLFHGTTGTVSTASAATAASTADTERQAGAVGTAAGETIDTALATIQLSEVNVQGQKRQPLPPMVQKFSALSVQDIQQA